MRTGIYAGSFDPITNGHFDILKRSAKLFDKVIVLVANNSRKTYLIPTETRVKLIKECTECIKNVVVDRFEGLTVEYAKKHYAEYLIRGVRTISDYEYETQMAEVNNSLSAGIQTIFIPATKETGFISSTMIRELLINKSDISAYVPAPVNRYFKEVVLK